METKPEEKTPFSCWSTQAVWGGWTYKMSCLFSISTKAVSLIRNRKDLFFKKLQIRKERVHLPAASSCMWSVNYDRIDLLWASAITVKNPSLISLSIWVWCLTVAHLLNFLEAQLAEIFSSKQWSGPFVAFLDLSVSDSTNEAPGGQNVSYHHASLSPALPCSCSLAGKGISNWSTWNKEMRKDRAQTWSFILPICS